MLQKHDNFKQSKKIYKWSRVTNTYRVKFPIFWPFPFLAGSTHMYTVKWSAVHYKKVQGSTVWVTSYFVTARDTPIIDETDGGPVNSVQCTVCSEKLQSAVCRVQCAVLLCKLCSFQCAVHCSVCSGQCTECRIQYEEGSLQSIEHDNRTPHFGPTNACQLLFQGWWSLQKQHKWYLRFRASQKYETLVGSEWTHKLCLMDEIKRLRSLVVQK